MKYWQFNSPKDFRTLSPWRSDLQSERHLLVVRTPRTNVI